MTNRDFKDSSTRPSPSGKSPAEAEKAHDSYPVKSTRQPSETVRLDPPEENKLPTKSLPLVMPEQQKTVISNRPPLSNIGERGGSLDELVKTLEGQWLGHFKLAEFVGGGGMGAVFRATDTMLGRVVAVKVLSQEQNSDAEVVRRFKNEAQSAARLDHDNIARVYYVGEDKGWNYIVFEFIEGTNVRDLVDQENRPLSLGKALSYLLQIAEALGHSSQRDVVHRDIKPSNVIITPQGRAKLVDMGLARLHQVESSENDLTASGVTLGTFDYISPEQARDPRCADVRSDLYSLGCTFFFMLTARPPFPDGTVLQKLLSHSSEPPPDLREFRPELPDEVLRILDKLLAKQPDQRYQTPSELIGEILLIGERLGLKLASHGAKVWVTPGESRYAKLEYHLPWAVPVTILLLSVLGLDIYWNLTSPKEVVPWKFQVPPSARANEIEGSSNKEQSNAAVLSNSPAEEPSPETEVVAEQNEIVSSTTALGTSSQGSGTSDSALSSNLINGTDSSLLPEESAALTELGPEPILAANEISGGQGLSAVWSVEARDKNDPGVIEIRNGDPLDPPLGKEAAPAAIATTTRVLVIGDEETDISPGERLFGSLALAVKKIQDFPDLLAIELRYNGVRREKPFTLDLTNSLLTIRKAEGYDPVIRFQPIAGDQLRYPRGMITLVGGDLLLEGLHFQMDIPRDDLVDRWALFDLKQPDSLELKRCTMTIRNAGTGRSSRHENVVSFFEVISPKISEKMIPDDDDEMMESVVPISLEDCIVRGEATFLRAEEVLPIRLTWKNGLLLTTERLLSTRGATDQRIEDLFVQITLDHVTVVADQGLCLMDNMNDSAPHQVTLDIQSDHCIFLAEQENAALIEQKGIYSVQEYQKKLRFGGERNFFQGTNVYQRMNARNYDQYEELSWKRWSDSDSMDLTLSRPGGVQWHSPPLSSEAIHRHTVESYRLTEHPSNPAFGYNPDGSSAGFDAESLPLLPFFQELILPEENKLPRDTFFGIPLRTERAAPF